MLAGVGPGGAGGGGGSGIGALDWESFGDVFDELGVWRVGGEFRGGEGVAEGADAIDKPEGERGVA